MAGGRPVQPAGGGGASAGAEAGPDRQTEGGGGAAERLPGDGASPHCSGTHRHHQNHLSSSAVDGLLQNNQSLLVKVTQLESCRLRCPSAGTIAREGVQTFERLAPIAELH